MEQAPLSRAVDVQGVLWTRGGGVASTVPGAIRFDTDRSPKASQPSVHERPTEAGAAGGSFIRSRCTLHRRPRRASHLRPAEHGAVPPPPPGTQAISYEPAFRALQGPVPCGAGWPGARNTPRNPSWTRRRALEPCPRAQSVRSRDRPRRSRADVPAPPPARAGIDAAGGGDVQRHQQPSREGGRSLLHRPILILIPATAYVPRAVPPQSRSAPRDPARRLLDASRQRTFHSGPQVTAARSPAARHVARSREAQAAGGRTR